MDSKKFNQAVRAARENFDANCTTAALRKVIEALEASASADVPAAAPAAPGN